MAQQSMFKVENSITTEIVIKSNITKSLKSHLSKEINPPNAKHY